MRSKYVVSTPDPERLAFWFIVVSLGLLGNGGKRMLYKRIVPLLLIVMLLTACGGATATDTPAAGAGSGAAGDTPTAGAQGSSGQVIVGLITKTDTNPFFVKMKEGAQAKA